MESQPVLPLVSFDQRVTEAFPAISLRRSVESFFALAFPPLRANRLIFMFAMDRLVT
jgi:hypothetical protein